MKTSQRNHSQHQYIHQNNDITDANQQQLQSQTVSNPSTTIDEKEYLSVAKSVSPSTPSSSPTLLSSTPSSSTPLSPVSLDHHSALLIFLDWDDTLFPTSQLMKILERKDENEDVCITSDEREQFNHLGHCTLSLLKRLIYKYGNECVHIVTNSGDGWIRQSLRYAACISNIYKDIAALLVSYNITMSSAQSIYAGKVLNSSPITWKMLCFADILNGSMTSYAHILSIGDQWLDHHAVKYSIDALNDCAAIHHIIKVKEEPTLSDMIHEMLYIQTAFDIIFDVDIAAAVVMDYSLEESKYRKAINIQSYSK